MIPPLSLEEAQARLLAMATPSPMECLAIDQAAGRYLAEPIIAHRTQPAADMSAMDGYAVSGDAVNDPALPGPWRIIGESAAGHPFVGDIGAGQAVRIATGALLPMGADRVLIQEDCARDGDKLTLAAPANGNRYVRRRGGDFVLGDVLLDAGARLGPAQLALALAAGYSEATVRQIPRVAIIESGDELVAPGDPCRPHRIPASNGAMLAALAGQLPCRVERRGPVPDDLAALVTAFHASADADIIVTSGGASVGDHDLIRPALAEYGAQIDFWRIAIKPGKPLLVARRGHQIVLGLPGNPASSFVTAWLFLMPLIRAMLGAGACLPTSVATRLAGPIAANGARRSFQRGVWDGAEAHPAGVDDSGGLVALARSNCLIDRPAHAPAAAAGAGVRVWPLALPIFA